ncbi:hypothetical protein BKA64DRAFT_174491 [Cadophora sp. MPI-SDFR-AT-0126]|nr:hypothetical protein BKA64DRAFT_174491 [Leotiomycetes sp. MPI-SDFR-AT-0126]
MGLSFLHFFRVRTFLFLLIIVVSPEDIRPSQTVRRPRGQPKHRGSANVFISYVHRPILSENAGILVYHFLSHEFLTKHNISGIVILFIHGMFHDRPPRSSHTVLPVLATAIGKTRDFSI